MEFCLLEFVDGMFLGKDGCTLCDSEEDAMLFSEHSYAEQYKNILDEPGKFKITKVKTEIDYGRFKEN